MVCIISILSLTSLSTSLLSSPLGTLLSVSISIGAFRFHQTFSSARLYYQAFQDCFKFSIIDATVIITLYYCYFFSILWRDSDISFMFTMWTGGTAKSTNWEKDTKIDKKFHQLRKRIHLLKGKRSICWEKDSLVKKTTHKFTKIFTT